MSCSTHLAPAENHSQQGDRLPLGQGHQNLVQVQGHPNPVGKEAFCTVTILTMRILFLQHEKEKDENRTPICSNKIQLQTTVIPLDIVEIKSGSRGGSGGWGAVFKYPMKMK